MTDARLPERWLSNRKLIRLSDSHFRSFVTALLWSVSNRTDGRIEREDLALIPNFAVGAPAAFVEAGLWTPMDHGWLISEFVVTQTSRDELEKLDNTRRRAREKKARQRAAKSAEKNAGDSDVPGDSPGDRSPGTTQARPGQARPGQETRGTALALIDGSEPEPEPEPEAGAWPAWRGRGPDPFEEYG
ncbi:hypothetical protein [Mycobacterium pseudokansasii]|uniref:hypothetical protein n=1 Tax=Mycobacterium pseudokansasii TaxID=2341080 RepID=UPI0007B50292|nr:hypothetical protein [Mycobacterium pseudokansasii]KZS65598.1 hypothetical protein A4G27_05480 [Mycobacterium kansasii]VAZ98571.1 hypothetical protein LAUMK35_04049 [Mycobacterium pseudokansasii]VAZ99990.1 hypothetical protein LAUMK21_04045 [Mycobacterium pseudokansasii]